MIPADPKAKLAYYAEFSASGMGPIAPNFGWGKPNGPKKR